jgi:membrane associated rhomboid family serine protease
MASTSPTTRTRSSARDAFLVVGGFVVLLWAIETLDVLLHHRLDGYGVEPREQDGLVGILFAPLLHGGWSHLAANTVPVLVLGFLVFLGGLAYGFGVTALVWLVAGVGVWLIGQDNSVHLGASVLVFGWLTCLLVRGFVSRSLGQLAVAVVVFLLYGGALWSVLPSQPGISWQGHLFGAIGGVIAALLLTERKRA